MKRRIEQAHIGSHHSALALSPNNISIERLCLPTEETAEEQPPAKKPLKSRQSQFNPDWHDAKEIVVPFDESSFSGLLVDEKTFQAAYSRNLPPQRLDHFRLNTMPTIGKVALTPDWLEDLLGFCHALLLFVELLLLVWTAALLLSGFPISKGFSYVLVALWPLSLAAFKFVLAKPMACRLLIWFGACLTTVSWLLWSPWSQDFIARSSSYFFRT
ncbi:hypothetical protein [Prosthecobacter sp.]|uniref:hypothetical protein n=1 Tax=Prosthecobacter sp. TaxID=1965333 RepID=UPI003782F6D2